MNFITLILTILKEQKIYGGHFEPDKKGIRIKELEDIMNNPNFWNNKKESEQVINELNNLKNNLEKVSTLKNKITSNFIF